MVHVDGQAVRSCVMPTATAVGKQITTLEDVGDTPVGAKVQKAWIDLDVVQCGYCQPGQIMSAAGLLAQVPKPQDADVNTAMSGNIYRCGTYKPIRAAIKQAAEA
jgi:isoquinoline 1-oxidoreductase alpha subunit